MADARFWRSGFRFGLFLVGFCWYLQHFRKLEGPSFQRGSCEFFCPFLVPFGVPLGALGGLLLASWGPLGCFGCRLGAPWCFKVVFWCPSGVLWGALGVSWGPLGASRWSFGRLVNGFLAPLVWPGACFGGPRGFSRILVAFLRAGQKPSSKKKSGRNANGTHPHARNILYKTALPVP